MFKKKFKKKNSCKILLHNTRSGTSNQLVEYNIIYPKLKNRKNIGKNKISFTCL